MNPEILTLIDNKQLSWNKLILGLKSDQPTMEESSKQVNINDIDGVVDRLKKTGACLEYLDTYECEGIVLRSTNNPSSRSTHTEDCTLLSF